MKRLAVVNGAAVAVVLTIAIAVPAATDLEARALAAALPGSVRMARADLALAVPALKEGADVPKAVEDLIDVTVVLEAGVLDGVASRNAATCRRCRRSM
jgi:hypothetical protein